MKTDGGRDKCTLGCKSACLPNSLELALSSDFLSLRLSLSLCLQLLLLQVVALKQDSDLVDLFLSLHDTDEFEMTDPEGIRLFRLTPLERSQLGELQY